MTSICQATRASARECFRSSLSDFVDGIAQTSFPRFPPIGIVRRWPRVSKPELLERIQAALDGC
jgi:hypothetical protein